MERRREGEEMPPPSNLARQPTHFADSRERTRNTGIPHVNTPRLVRWPRGGPILLGAKLRVVLSRDCPKWSTGPGVLRVNDV